MTFFLDQFERGISRVLTRIAVFSVLAVSSLTAATVQYSVQSLGPNGMGDAVFRYTYDLSGIALQENQELQIRFSPVLFGELSNPVASADFDVLLFQPNDPPGAPGDFLALALVNDPSLLPAFSVDAVYFGPGTPGAQEFLINQYEFSAGTYIFLETLESGFTVAAGGVTPIPEPATSAVCGLGLLAVGLVEARRRFGRRT